MELKLISEKGGDKGSAGTVSAKDEIFARDFNETLVHQLVVAYPDLASFPQVTLVALVGSVLGLLAAAAAPQPRMVHA